MNQITIGNGPDFVMRAGPTTYSHHVSIIFTLIVGAPASESISNPSLQATLRELKQKLESKGWLKSTQISWKLNEDFVGLFKSSFGQTAIRYHFLTGLDAQQKQRLMLRIIEVFKPI